MKTNLIAIALAAGLSGTMHAQQAFDDSSSRKSSAERIERTHGLKIDWSKSSLTSLLDMESRLGTASRIKRSYGATVDWKTQSLSSLLDMEARMGAVARIKRTHNLAYDWQKNSLSSLLDAEGRMGAAARLSKAIGQEVDWNKFTLAQLLDAEAKLSAKQNPQRMPAQPAGAPVAAAPAVIETQMDGEFEGWDGETIFKLANGQIWQQTEYAYTYRYAFRPKVLIYRSQTGGWKMKVDGIDRAIGVEKLK
jgi:hypothetical protein